MGARLSTDERLSALEHEVSELKGLAAELLRRLDAVLAKGGQNR